MADLDAYLKKRMAETGPAELDPKAARATKGASKAAATGKDDVWAEQAPAEVLPTGKKVVDVSYAFPPFFNFWIVIVVDC